MKALVRKYVFGGIEWLSRFLPPLVVMAIIYWWSAKQVLPGATAGLVWWDFVIKKTAHMVEYALLFFCWQRAINWRRPLHKISYTSSFIIVFCYALTDEIHQSFTPGRHPLFRDTGFDLLGSYLVFGWIHNRS